MKPFVFVLFAASALAASVVSGQSTAARSAREEVIQSFDRKSPAVGEQLPNLRVYNASGDPLHLGELKGNYTVLVFGCLT